MIFYLFQVLARLREEATICVAILEIFQNGSVIMDEVDLLLHPLKSELNWPLGEKMPLDFTTENTLGVGLRWAVPWYLLDSLFFWSEGRITSNLEQSREAEEILEKLKQKIDEGCAERHLQSSPHLVRACS